MATFTPVNSLEIKLRAMLTDKNTPSWSFYTPLAAMPLWLIVRHHPELDGSGLLAPPGKNPEVCIFNWPDATVVGIYTAACRAQEVFAKFNIPRHEWTVASAPGYQLLKFVSQFDAHLVINAGLAECRYQLDPDMVEILLSRPEPKPANASPTKVNFHPPGHPEKFLGPLREFLGRQPKVRAAWIFGYKPEQPLPAGSQGYEVELVMEDPEDKSLVQEVKVMAKALTPVEMEWVIGVMVADDNSLRNLSKQAPPFYARADFLKS